MGFEEMTAVNWASLTTIPSAIQRYRYGRGRHARTALRIQDTFNKAKRNAKRRGFAWALTPETFIALWRDDCPLCGVPFVAQGDRWRARSLDRIDASKDYLEDNVRFICFGCNAMRSLNEINARRRKSCEPWL